MANRITVNICGEDYTLVAEESTAYMEQVASLVDKKMTEIIAGTKVGRGDAAVLAAVNLADELLKSEQTAENLRRDLLELWIEKKIPTKAIILVTHGIEEAVYLADRVVILSSGPASAAEKRSAVC